MKVLVLTLVLLLVICGVVATVNDMRMHEHISRFAINPQIDVAPTITILFYHRPGESFELITQYPIYEKLILTDEELMRWQDYCENCSYESLVQANAEAKKFNLMGMSPYIYIGIAGTDYTIIQGMPSQESFDKIIRLKETNIGQ